MALGFALANTLEPVVGALLLIWAVRSTGEGLLSRMVRFIAFPVALAPIAAAAVGASFATLVARLPRHRADGPEDEAPASRGDARRPLLNGLAADPGPISRARPEPAA